MRGVESSARDAARKLLWRGLLGLSGCLAGLVALGFLTASAFVALSAELGAGLAALFIGIGFLVFAVALLALASGHRPDPNAAKTPVPPPVASGAETPDEAAIIAFTAAFVLARYLTGGKPD